MKVTLNREKLKQVIKRKIGEEITRRLATKPWAHTNELWNGQTPAMWVYGSTGNRVIMHQLVTDYEGYCSADGVLTINLIFDTFEQVV